MSLRTSIKNRYIPENVRFLVADEGISEGTAALLLKKLSLVVFKKIAFYHY